MHRHHPPLLLWVFILAASAGGCSTSKVETEQKPATEPKAENPHAIDPSATSEGRVCHAAFEDGTCTDRFAQVTACEGKSDATLLRPGLAAGAQGEGCYYFCPDVPNCESLTLEEAAALACKYAAANDIHQALTLRSLCGPEADSGFGTCCFGLDASTRYD